MQPSKLEGNIFRKKCESTLIPSGKSPRGIPIPTPKKPCLSNKTKRDMPSPTIGSNAIRKHNYLAPELRKVSKLTTPKLNLKRKSISLVDLNLANKIQTPIKCQSREQGDETNIYGTPLNKCEIPNFTSSRELELAKVVCKTLYLRVWRRRRSQVRELQSINQNLVNENGNLEVQTNVLRNLLDSEQLRVTGLTGDIAHLKQLLETESKASKEKDKILDRLEADKSAWEVLRSQMAADVQFLSENLTFQNTNVEDLNVKLQIQQQDLEISKNNEVELVDKLNLVENQLAYRLKLINEMDKKHADFETKLTDLKCTMNLLTKENENKKKEINECSEKIKNMAEEITKLQLSRKVQKDNVKNLEKEIAMKLHDIERKDLAIMSLENVITQHELEQEQFRRNLKKVRNTVVFEAIKFCASLFFPKPPSMAF